MFRYTSHSAYVATSTESEGVKMDGFLYRNFISEKFTTVVEKNKNKFFSKPKLGDQRKKI